MEFTAVPPKTPLRHLPTPWRSTSLLHLPTPFPAEYSLTSDVFFLLDKQLQRITSGLQELAAQSQAMEAAENDLSRVLAQLLPDQAPHPVVSPAPPEQHDFALQLVDFPIPPLYVKRRFDLSFKLITKNGELLCAESPLCCVLSVHKMDTENTEVKEARSGEIHTGRDFLRGQLTQVFTEGPVMTFRNLLFTDISSPFPQGRVNLFVHCLNLPHCKPLFVEGIRVKARKKRPDEVI